MGTSGWRDLLWIASMATCVKLLMVPSYHSTDFEVHRHWLAITHSLPLKEWYMDETSEWTLDYPPFFAWFERFLAVFASSVDPRMVDLVSGLNYASYSAILFQRATVIMADGVLYYGLWQFGRKLSARQQRIVYAAVILSPGLLMVDHMHFQYNGFLLGILMLSLSCLRDGRDLMGGLWFAVLVCFKHLFAVAGPIYFVYLLRHYCRGPWGLTNFLTLGSTVLSVVVVAFGPFVYYDQMGHVLKRLFPFGRGLCHAYWAPNFWALYNTADKVLAVIFRKLGMDLRTAKAGMTGGLVGDFSGHAVLPQITPTVTAAMVLLAMLPCLIRIWRKPRQSEVVQWIAYGYTCGYMFGWHVHEKAALHFVIPLGLSIADSVEASGDFLFMSTVSYYSLFPLLFEVKEYPIKVLLLLLHTFALAIHQSHYFRTLFSGKMDKVREENVGHVLDTTAKSIASHQSYLKNHSIMQKSQTFGSYRVLFLWGLTVVELYSQFLHGVLFNDRLPFVPLMLVSVYCAIGLFYAWAKQLKSVLSKA